MIKTFDRTSSFEQLCGSVWAADLRLQIVSHSDTEGIHFNFYLEFCKFSVPLKIFRFDSIPSTKSVRQWVTEELVELHFSILLFAQHGALLRVEEGENGSTRSSVPCWTEQLHFCSVFIYIVNTESYNKMLNLLFFICLIYNMVIVYFEKFLDKVYWCRKLFSQNIFLGIF